MVSFPSDLTPIKEKVDHFLNVLVPASGLSALEPGMLKKTAVVVFILIFYSEETLTSPQSLFSPKPTHPKKLSDGNKHQFLDFHPTEVARQLTLMEHQRFRDIPVCTLFYVFFFFWCSFLNAENRVCEARVEQKGRC